MVRVWPLFARPLRKSKGIFAYWHRGVEESLVQDLIFIVATVVIFGMAILYVRGCERLK